MIYIIILLIYFSYSYYFQIKISKTSSINTNFKKQYKRLTWVLPFLGPIIVLNAIKNRSKKDKELSQKQKSEKVHFYESGKGIFGP